MNVDEMRSELHDYCMGKHCSDCQLSGDTCKCCRAISFTSNENGKYDMSDEEVIKAYRIVFPSGEPDMVNHPKHYNREGAMECIEEMIVVFGIVPTYHFCRLNAWKYRYRQNDKGGLLDMEKSDNYIRKAAELKVRMKQEGTYDHRTTMETSGRL